MKEIIRFYITPSDEEDFGEDIYLQMNLPDEIKAANAMIGDLWDRIREDDERHTDMESSILKAAMELDPGADIVYLTTICI